MRVLFVGEGWQGSTSRSLCEALARWENVDVCDLWTDAILPLYQDRKLRVSNRILKVFQSAELVSRVRKLAEDVSPDFIIVYKGAQLNAEAIRSFQKDFCPVVNVFPDLSPLSHGDTLREALGIYDLVISNKRFHPEMWQQDYRFSNRCIYVAHGYDPDLHLSNDYPGKFEYDLVLAGTGRPEYYALINNLAERLGASDLKVLITGSQWRASEFDLPAGWAIKPACFGRGYVSRVRSARLVLAPIQTNISVGGRPHPGDEDSTRTYELAAAHCCFIHRRNDYMESIYDENHEVPMYSEIGELAGIIAKLLPDYDRRRSLSEAAHRRAVPAYSLDRRADEIMAHLQSI